MEKWPQQRLLSTMIKLPFFTRIQLPNGVFGQELTEEAKALCYMQLTDDKEDAFVVITEALLQKQTLTEILEETYKLQIA